MAFFRCFGEASRLFKGFCWAREAPRLAIANPCGLDPKIGSFERAAKSCDHQALYGVAVAVFPEFPGSFLVHLGDSETH